MNYHLPLEVHAAEGSLDLQPVTMEDWIKASDPFPSTPLCHIVALGSYLSWWIAREKKAADALGCFCFVPFQTATLCNHLDFWEVGKEKLHTDHMNSAVYPGGRWAYQKEERQAHTHTENQLQEWGRLRINFDSEWFLRKKIHSKISTASQHFQEEWKTDHQSARCGSCVQPHQRSMNRENREYWAQLSVN